MGSVKLEVTELTDRCVMTILGQDNLPSNPRIHEVIGKELDNKLGVYARVIENGTIHQGNAVQLENDT